VGISVYTESKSPVYSEESVALPEGDGYEPNVLDDWGGAKGLDINSENQPADAPRAERTGGFFTPSTDPPPPTIQKNTEGFFSPDTGPTTKAGGFFSPDIHKSAPETVEEPETSSNVTSIKGADSTKPVNTPGEIENKSGEKVVRTILGILAGIAGILLAVVTFGAAIPAEIALAATIVEGAASLWPYLAPLLF
jgi:hypothetical protein